MKKTKIRKEKIFKYIIAFMIPVICIVAHMIMTNCYPFGKNSVLLGDSNTQYYAFYMELSDRIRNGKSLFFSWSMGLGYDFYSNFFYYLASPFNLIAVAFGGSHVFVIPSDLFCNLIVFVVLIYNTFEHFAILFCSFFQKSIHFVYN